MMETSSAVLSMTISEQREPCPLSSQAEPALPLSVTFIPESTMRGLSLNKSCVNSMPVSMTATLTASVEISLLAIYSFALCVPSIASAYGTSSDLTTLSLTA